MRYLIQIRRDQKIELSSQGTKDCQNLRYGKSDYCLSEMNRNYQSLYVDYRI